MVESYDGETVTGRGLVALPGTSAEGEGSVVIGVTDNGAWPTDSEGRPAAYFASPMEARLFASLIVDAADTVEQNKAVANRKGFMVIDGGEG